MKKLWIVLVITSLITGCSTTSRLGDGNTKKETDDFYETQAEKISEKDILAAENVVANAHEYLNHSIGWGETPENYDKFAILGNELEQACMVLESESLKEDLATAALLLKKGEKEKDNQYLKYAHRILHDLDAYYFHKQDKDYFRVTKTLEGKNAYKKYSD